MMSKVLFSVDQFSEAVGYRTQSIYNMIYIKMFILGVHYYKPSSRKILFCEETVEAFLSGTIRRDFEARRKTDRAGASLKKAAAIKSKNHLPGSQAKLPSVRIDALKARLEFAELTP